MTQQQISKLCDIDGYMYRLISLYCADHPSEKEIADWFSAIDFEALRPEISCMAAIVSSANGYCGVPEALIPRLKGILKYVHTLNSSMTAGLCALGKHLSAAGIPFTLLRRSAVQLHYPNAPQRHIWEMQIGVSEADFSHIAALAGEAGFTAHQEPYHILLQRGNAQSINVFKLAAQEETADTITVGGVVFHVPSSEHLTVSLADATFGALSRFGGATLVPWIMDLHCVITNGVNWEHVAAIANKQGIASRVRLVLEIYDQLIPDVLPKDMINTLCPEKKTIRLAKSVIPYRTIKPKRNRLKRLWCSAWVHHNDNPKAALRAFCLGILRGIRKKITPHG